MPAGHTQQKLTQVTPRGLHSAMRRLKRSQSLSRLRRERSCAAFRISPQVRCMNISSFSADLLQVVLGLPGRCFSPLVYKASLL